MKFFIISDIHGSATFLQEALDKYRESQADYLIILGDILYHGPRNPLPKGYNPSRVAELLNPLSKKIIAVRGNCDSEVDQMVLDFPILEENILIHNDQKLFITHGHLRDSSKQLIRGDMFLHGHTHIYRAVDIDGVIYLNPGSISLPKEDNPRTFAVLDDTFRVYDFDDNLLLTK